MLLPPSSSRQLGGMYLPSPQIHSIHGEILQLLGHHQHKAGTIMQKSSSLHVSFTLQLLRNNIFFHPLVSKEETRAQSWIQLWITAEPYMDEDKGDNYVKLVQGPSHMKIWDNFFFLSILPGTEWGNRDKELSLTLFCNPRYTWHFSKCPAKRCTTSLVMQIGLLV